MTGRERCWVFAALAVGIVLRIRSTVGVTANVDAAGYVDNARHMT